MGLFFSPVLLLTSVGVLVSGCGGTDRGSFGLAAAAEESLAPKAQESLAATEDEESEHAAVEVREESEPVGESSEVFESNDLAAELEAAEPPPPLSRCATPSGVSGAPETIDELILLINSLPKPVTLPCFLESLERPLDVFLTRSAQSAQPAVGPDNPRVFVFYGRLSFTIVPGGGGESSEVLEFAFRTSDELVDRQLAQVRDVTIQAVRGEVSFPVYRTITDAYLADRIDGGLGSLCGGCHLAERSTTPAEGYFEGAFASNVMPPFPSYDVALSSLREQAVLCDPEVDRERCEVLSALFDHGEVRAYDFR